MMFGDWIRRCGFWTLDLLRGGGIRKNYKEIKDCLEHKDINTRQLSKILKHAVATTKFYKDCDPDDINSFPVITKAQIKNNWDEMYSWEYRGKPMHHMATSGSTGTPFVMDWDMGKRKRQLAELVYFNELAGQKLGQPFVFFRVWTGHNRKSRREQWMQNLTPINILHLDDSALETIRQRLKGKPYINMCLGYVQMASYNGRFCGAKRPRCGAERPAFL